MKPSHLLKVDRAEKHILEVNKFIQERSPFRYTFECDCQTGKCSIGSKRDEAIIAEMGLLVGDAIHNLRSALDHRVWDLVSPHCNEAERKKIQFPFLKTSGEEDIKSHFESRKIHRAAKEVWTALEDLKPYPGGNDNLVLIHELDIIDKHKLLIPAANYAHVTGEQLRTIFPGLPIYGTFGFSNNARDLAWTSEPVSRADRRRLGIERHIEKDIPIPVEIIISQPGVAPIRPLMPLLYCLVETTKDALSSLAKL